MKTILTSVCYLLFAVLLLTGCQKEVSSGTLIDKNPPVANAGTSQSIQASQSTVNLTGTGISSNGPITGYLWSLVTGPNVPVIVSPSSPTTAITGLVSGTYIFQFAVIDIAGLTGVDTVSVTVLPSLSQTLILQPASSPGELVLVQTSPNYSDPLSPEIIAEAWTNGGTFDCRSLFKFDLSSIPANATIISAKLSLYSNPTPLNGNLIDPNFGTDNSLFLERVSGNWNNGTLWQSQPSADIATRISLPHTNQRILDLIDIDVKNQVAAMVTNGNYGFKLRLQNEVLYNSRIFCSSRHSIAAKHPKIVIVYQ